MLDHHTRQYLRHAISHHRKARLTTWETPHKPCKGCGNPHAEQTPGCKTCHERHRKKKPIVGRAPS